MYARGRQLSTSGLEGGTALTVRCTDAEWKIMECLWEQSPRTIAEITHALEAQTGWTRHTVITLLKRMQAKGSVTVDETEAVKRYRPALSRQEAAAEQTGRLLTRVFAGDASLLIHNLVDSGAISVPEMQELLALLRQGEVPGTHEGGEPDARGNGV